MEKTAKSGLSVRKVVQETWREGLLECIEGDPNLELLAISCAEEADDQRFHALLLREILELCGGERAYVFDVEPVRGDVPEMSRCSASLDLDGDPVSSPERKVPPDMLLEVAQSRRPAVRAWSEGAAGGARASSLLALPAISRESCQAILVVENRFQELAVSRESSRLLLFYARLLAQRLDLRRLSRENDGLWRDLHRLRDSLDSATEGSAPPRIASGKTRAEKRKGLKGDYSMIVGSSSKMIEILQVIDRISGSTAPVLINGESGTGKELVALAVHANSPRKGKAFVSENCAAITETLLESELFGYVKGAFTGANKDHKGLFEVADGGTLFLDEVGDMSPSMQKKLLRVLQEGVIRRVGAKDYTKVDVRIISATNKDLLAECRRSTFREDLYYRLNVINLELPPLRDRRDDIPEIVQYFLDELAKESGKAKRIDPQAMLKLNQYSWPGNVRELQNEVKKLFALSESDVITTEDLSEALLAGDVRESPFRDQGFDLSSMTLKEATEQLEQEMIRQALAESGGNKTLVAKTLQIPKTSLYNKINKYKLG